MYLSFQGHAKLSMYGLYYMTDYGADVGFPIGYVWCILYSYFMLVCSIVKTENFTKSVQIWSQNVPLVLTKKMSTHTLCF